MSPLEAARTTLANYDAPRCGATFAHVFTDNSGCGIEAVARTCRRHAGHPTDGREGHSEFGDRIPGPDHLRTALAEVDRLTAERDRLALTLRCERGKWAPEGWAWDRGAWWWHPDHGAVCRIMVSVAGVLRPAWGRVTAGGVTVPGSWPTALEAIESCGAANRSAS